MEMYDNENMVQKSFDTDFLPEELLQAQWAEFIELKKVITEIYQRKQSPIQVLDIGIGNARIARHLSGVKEIWDMIAVYDGTDNAEPCIKISNEVIKQLKIDDKVATHFFDAINLSQWKKKYDLIITTWFTAGNFYPNDFDFDNYQPGTLDLSHNKKFEQIFSGAYSLLNPGGEIVIGACYIDNDNTRKKQESFYKKMGMTVITNKKDHFTATKERFWSQRFTEEKLKAYLHFVDPGNISFTPLDTYNFARQVRIRK
ncbi:MAG: methyltransferase domain-containing protein [Sphingobacteriales bacterium]|nr:methyltransferase domain-containing protein [Sphingobacteriales bacterium]